MGKTYPAENVWQLAEDLNILQVEAALSYYIIWKLGKANGVKIEGVGRKVYFEK